MLCAQVFLKGLASAAAEGGQELATVLNTTSVSVHLLTQHLLPSFAHYTL